MTGSGGGEMGEEALQLLPELLLLLGAVGGLLLGLWTPRDRQGRVALVAVLACLASATVSAVDLAGPTHAVFEGTWVIDTTTGVVRVTVALATAVTVGLVSSALSGHPRETEAYVLMVLGAIGAVALLATGKTGYDGLATRLPEAPTPVLAVGVLGALAGVGFKAGAVPVHFWVPDVTAGTTPAMAAYITTIPKLGAVAAAFRLLAEPFADVPLDVPLVVALIAAASMTLGNLAAFSQTEVLRLLAYSTVSQVGYLFMVVAVAARTDLAAPALAIYLSGYAVTNLGAFAAAAALPTAATIADWSAAAARNRWLTVSLVVCLLGLVGTPPTAVFVGKLAVFTAAADGALMWLVVLAALNTVASLFYYLRWIAAAAGPDAAPRAVDGAGADATDHGLPEGASIRRSANAPSVTLHAVAFASVLLGVGASLWLAAVSG